MLYIYNLQKQFKDQIIGILEEIDSFYWPKCTYENVTKNLGRALPHLDKIQKNSSFFSWSLPLHHSSKYIIWYLIFLFSPTCEAVELKEVAHHPTSVSD